MSRTLAIIQARMGSRRLPGKVLREIQGRPILWHIVERLRWSRQLDGVAIATSDRPTDRAIVDFAARHGIACFTGSETDVLDRFYGAACAFDADPVVRITGDCALVDPELVDRVVIELLRKDRYLDYIAVVTGAGGSAAEFAGRGFPDGLDAEAFRRSALERAWREATDPAEREHATLRIWRNPHLFALGYVTSEQDHSALRWVVDDHEDLEFVAAVYQDLYDRGRPFLWRDVLSLLERRPDLLDACTRMDWRDQYRSVREAANR